MKLRIRGNTLRLRLSRSEVATVAEGGRVEEATRFGPAPGQTLTYSVEASAALGRPGASMDGTRIRVALPAAQAKNWATGDDVGIEAEQPVGGGQTLRLLIEKDFECLDAPPTEDQSDAFPHPLRGSPCPPGKMDC